MNVTSEIVQNTKMKAYSHGSKNGLPATAENIRQGTVMMEHHPDYAEVITFFESNGYQVRPSFTYPQVRSEKFSPSEGNAYITHQLLLCQRHEIY